MLDQKAVCESLLKLKLSLFLYLIEALKEAKMLYFTGAEENVEPVNSLHAGADGTMKAIGHLFAASICNYGPAPIFINMDIQLHCWWN